MRSVKRFRNQAEKCAALAKQTHDEDSRQRLVQLERTFLHLAESEEQQLAAELSALAAANEPKPADPR